MLILVDGHLRKQKNRIMDLVTSPASKRERADKLSSKKDRPSSCSCVHEFMEGEGLSIANYQLATFLADKLAPFNHDVDHGATSITGADKTPNSVFRSGASFIARKNFTIKSVYGYTTSNAGNVYSIALARITPVMGNNGSITPVALYEESFTGLSSNAKLIKIETESFTNTHINKGDIVFTMFKGDAGGDAIYWRFWLELE